MVFHPAGESTMITVRHATALRGGGRLAGTGGIDGMEPRARDLVGAAVLVAVLVALIVLLVVAALPS